MCDAGYTDSDCSTELGHVPTLFKLPGHGRCDLALKPCEFTIVNADKFVADSVHCRLALKDVSNRGGYRVSVLGEGRSAYTENLRGKYSSQYDKSRYSM